MDEAIEQSKHEFLQIEEQLIKHAEEESKKLQDESEVKMVLEK